MARKVYDLLQFGRTEAITSVLSTLEARLRGRYAIPKEMGSPEGWSVPGL